MESAKTSKAVASDSKLPKIASLEIHYSKPIYFAGDFVSGCVQLELNRPIKASQLKFEILGRASTKWIEAEEIRKHHTRVCGEKDYINNTLIFWQQSNKKELLDQGTHTYEFSVQIPPDAPSTFSFPPKAYVAYYCRANLKMEQFWKSDKTTAKSFTVLSMLNLNLAPDMAAVNFKVDKCDGKISLTLLMEKSRFLPNETITLEARVSNNSSRKIEKLEADLFQFITLTGYTQEENGGKCHRHKKLPMAHYDIKLDMGPKTPNRQIFWDLKLPAVTPTLKTCPIIDIYYILIFKLIIGGVFIVPLMMSVPITLGTVACDAGQGDSSSLPPPYPGPDPFELDQVTEWFEEETIESDMQEDK